MKAPKKLSLNKAIFLETELNNGRITETVNYDSGETRSCFKCAFLIACGLAKNGEATSAYYNYIGRGPNDTEMGTPSNLQLLRKKFAYLCAILDIYEAKLQSGSKPESLKKKFLAEIEKLIKKAGGGASLIEII